MAEPQSSTAAFRMSDTTAATRDAATLVLLREGDDGPEVLLLERHLRSDFAGGALVFPGGTVDAPDRALAPERWSGREPSAWQGLLGADSPEAALGLMVAAIRESFEEANILLARRRGQPITDAELASASFVEARRRLSSREERFDWREWLAAEELVLDLGALAPWAWWVTPKGPHKRFDTRFFVASLPADQSGRCDDVETTALRWISPEQALAAQRKGEATVIFPTRRNLAALARYDSAAAIWRTADAGDSDMRRIEPEVVMVDDEPRVLHPDDNDPEAV
ncbi:NUDIX hydrolase [Algiphilus aromaticivorans]|uniref:NUDIX hydrolase n=1 Tax=Algiphilus aromaticivorans TaxID=382454 RepID=UPI000694C453|nr:hypothetical protein [Algiphilus aromaticivorans]